jgi:hypothetical protein
MGKQSNREERSQERRVLCEVEEDPRSHAINVSRTLLTEGRKLTTIYQAYSSGAG